jgi:hypothetical protein
MALPQSGSGVSFSLGVGANIAGDASLTFDARANVLYDGHYFRNVCSVFESVQLVSVQVDISLPALSAGRVSYGFYPSNETVPGTIDTVARSYCGSIAYFSPQQAQTFAVSLPASHVFGTELKAAVLGNSPPVFFLFTSDTPAAAARQVTATAIARFSILGHGRIPEHARPAS